MEDEFKLGIAVIVGVVLLCAMIGSCTYQQEIVLPQKMAERNYCLRSLVGQSYATYQPCPKVEP